MEDVLFHMVSDFLHHHKGMLASADTVKVVAEAFRHHHITQSVVDPVRRHTIHPSHCSSHIDPR